MTNEQPGKLFNYSSNLENPQEWFKDSLGGRKTDSGVRVNESSSIGYAPVWYAVNKISGHVGQLPLTVYRRLDRGAEKATNHPAYRLLRSRPNQYQTAIQFKESLMAHALLWGNGRAAIVRGDAGQPVELLPMMPDRTMTCMVEGEKWHLLTINRDDRLAELGGTKDGSLQGTTYKIPDHDVIHIPGLGFDGVAGVSLVQVAKNVLGLGLASEKAASKDFANGSKPSILLKAPHGTFRSEEDATEFMSGFTRFHTGLDNRGRVGLLREGIDATTLNVSAEDSQWIDQRKFQRQDTALLFLLEQILGDDSSVSYNSLEQKNLAYLSNCLMRWLVKWEQECDHKLLSQRQKRADSHFFKFNTAALLRSDYKSTIEALGVAISHRIISPNEGREKLDMNPYEGGDEYANPAITPGASGATQDDPASVEDANRAALVAHLTHMIGVESNRVLNAAGNKRNYVGWVESFYRDWQTTLHQAIESFGGTPELAKIHCQTSHQEIVEVAGSVTADGLADAIAEVVSGWESRSQWLADSILNKEYCSV